MSLRSPLLVAVLVVAAVAAAAPKRPPRRGATPAAVDAGTAVPKASDAPVTPTAVVPAATRPAPSRPLMPSSHAGAGSHCASCHSAASWSEVRFNHDPTGFPLRGRHARAICKACHVGPFTQTLPRQCVGCHEDAHGGDVGARCEGCHDETSWHSSFGIEGHRRSGFPLLGAHAAVPCLECHPDAREKRFARPAVQCASCHQAERQSARLDHTRLGLTGPCQDCHGPTRFSPAAFPGHDACFFISGTSHAALRCNDCHQPEVPNTVTPGTCSTGNATCTGCHTHRCAGPGSSLPTDREHQGVLGYQCADRLCFQCHQGTRP